MCAYADAGTAKNIWPLHTGPLRTSARECNPSNARRLQTGGRVPQRTDQKSQWHGSRVAWTHKDALPRAINRSAQGPGASLAPDGGLRSDMTAVQRAIWRVRLQDGRRDAL